MKKILEIRGYFLDILHKAAFLYILFTSLRYNGFIKDEEEDLL